MGSGAGVTTGIGAARAALLAAEQEVAEDLGGLLARGDDGGRRVGERGAVELRGTADPIGAHARGGGAHRLGDVAQFPRDTSGECPRDKPSGFSHTRNGVTTRSRAGQEAPVSHHQQLQCQGMNQEKKQHTMSYAPYSCSCGAELPDQVTRGAARVRGQPLHGLLRHHRGGAVPRLATPLPGLRRDRPPGPAARLGAGARRGRVGHPRPGGPGAAAGTAVPPVRARRPGARTPQPRSRGGCRSAPGCGTCCCSSGRRARSS